MEKERSEIIAKLSDALALDKLVAEILVDRGVDTPEKARKFLYPSKNDFSDPFSLTGMQGAVDRIRQAVKDGEKIVIYGDYDCDGITATAILYGYLSSVGADVDYFIPNRFDTGYGLTTEALEMIAETYYPDLIVTVDCGVSSKEEAEYLEEVLAIDLVVTDHHMLPEVLPNTVVVNPKQDADSPCVDLCGAGVAFKLVQALGGFDTAWKYVELAAVATITDVVPLTGENRLIVSLGLKKINSREAINKGLRLLIESMELKGPVDPHTVGFQIGPRINSLGRLGDTTESVRLFVDEEFVELQGIVEKMNRANELRKSLVEKTYLEAKELLKEYDLATHKIIMLCKEDWSSGIIGLVSGRLRNEYNRPVILLAGEDVLVGSGRAGEGVDIHATIKSAEKLLERFGGHKSAAGLTVKRENLIDARNAMDAFLEKTYPNEVYSRSAQYEFALRPEQVTLSLAESVALLEPFGVGNPKPVFKFSSSDISLAPLGNGETVKGKLNADADIIAFRKSYLLEGLELGLSYDFLCELSKNEFRNVVKAQMIINDVFVVGEPTGETRNVALFNRYLRSNLYREEKCDYTVLSDEDLKDAFYDDDFCTLFLSFSAESASRFSADCDKKRCSRTEYARSFDAPWNEVLIAPDADPVGYRKIVLLDTPLTTGYVSRLVKATGAEVAVVKNRYPYRDAFKNADISVAALTATYQKINKFIFSGAGATSPVDLAKRLSAGKEEEFLVHFYILYEAGAISVGQGFALYARQMGDPAASVLYKRLMALKKIL